MSLKHYVRRFSEVSVLVVGDLMLDRYIWGEVSRISPEAPVQVVNVRKESLAPGGAANVAANIGALRGKSIVVGVLGRDGAKRELARIMKRYSADIRSVFTDPKKPTTHKVRVMAQSQQLLRIDYENTEYINRDDEAKTIANIRKRIREANAVVVSDYAKGIITERIMRALVRLSKRTGIPLIVDPKPRHAPLYRDSTLITPNEKEAREMALVLGIRGEDIAGIGRGIQKKTGSNILVTRGEKGMSLLPLKGSAIHIPTMAKEVYDVTGAGDTVVAVLALALGAGTGLEEAAVLANHAAGITVAKVGTSTVSQDELIKALGE